ncbi:hypothetical protein MBLNU13_g02387t1 [Cladosporium sp. NU13]
MATNASSDVFSTWELCENIIKFLPCDDLVRAKRVSSTLKNVVEQTAALQEPLFLQPRTETSVWTITTCASGWNHVSCYADRFDTIIDPAAGIPRHSSLGKMFLSQPPVNQVRVALKCRCGRTLTLKCPEEHFDPNGSIAIRNDSGVTFGQVRDCVRFALQQCATALFDYLMFGKGLPATRREKQSVEAAGPLLWESDPFLTAALATIERLGLVV